MSDRRFWRGRLHHLALGGAVTLAVVLGTAALSAWPAWQSLPPDTAVVRLSFTHSGARTCRDRTAEELAKLPPNMRSAQLCERRRAPVAVEMEVDGALVLATDLPPSGLAGSGPSRIYYRLDLPAGPHLVAVRMRDDPAAPDFTQRGEFQLDLAPAQSVSVDYDPTRAAFYLH